MSGDKNIDIADMNALVDRILSANCLDDFDRAIHDHERLVSSVTGLTPVKQHLFPDYWGEIKSLGAWGGDFVLGTSAAGDDKTFAYFRSHGYNTILKYKDIVL